MIKYLKSKYKKTIYSDKTLLYQDGVIVFQCKIQKTKKSTDKLLDCYAKQQDSATSFIYTNDDIPQETLRRRTALFPAGSYDEFYKPYGNDGHISMILQRNEQEHRIRSRPIKEKIKCVRGVADQRTVGVQGEDPLNEANAMKTNYSLFVTQSKKLAKQYASSCNETQKPLFVHYDIALGTLMGARFFPLPSTSTERRDIFTPEESEHHLYIVPHQKTQFRSACETPRGTIHAYFSVRPSET